MIWVIGCEIIPRQNHSKELKLPECLILISPTLHWRLNNRQPETEWFCLQCWCLVSKYIFLVIVFLTVFNGFWLFWKGPLALPYHEVVAANPESGCLGLGLPPFLVNSLTSCSPMLRHQYSPFVLLICLSLCTLLDISLAFQYPLENFLCLLESTIKLSKFWIGRTRGSRGPSAGGARGGAPALPVTSCPQRSYGLWSGTGYRLRVSAFLPTHIHNRWASPVLHIG